jgi:hypothetical protein
MKIKLSLFYILFFSIGSLYSFSVDSLKIGNLADSSLALNDTNVVVDKPLAKKKYELAPQWISAENILLNAFDSTKNLYYHFKRLKQTHYNDVSDVFRNAGHFMIFDRMEPGLPKFFSHLNLFPHQNAVSLNGTVMNNPLNGMFNTRFLSLDNVEAMEFNEQAVTPFGLNTSINIHTRQIIPFEPYTRLMYRQGDYGYTDFDITFARKLNHQFSFQLGALNKYYDPNGYRGTNFRGHFHYQYAENLKLTTQFNLNREKRSVYSSSIFSYTVLSEWQDFIEMELTQSTPNDSSQYWQIKTAYTSSERKVNTKQDTIPFQFKNSFERLNLAINHNAAMLDILKLNSIISYTHLGVWGESFRSKYSFHYLGGNFSVQYPASNRFHLLGGANFYWQIANALQTGIYTKLKWMGKKLHIHLTLKNNERLPLINEQYFHMWRHRGNSSLKNETLRTIRAEAKYHFSDYFTVDAAYAYHSLHHEILFDTTFYNAVNGRNFSTAETGAVFQFDKFAARLSGSYIPSGVSLSPQTRFIAELRYQDIWINGAVMIDLVASYYWNDQHKTIHFNPIIERFSYGQTEQEGYSYYTFKATATVQDAQFFLALDNPFAKVYSFVSGYPQTSRRIQFGVNWVMWD